MLAWLERNAFVVIAFAGVLVLGGLGVRELASSGPEPVLVVRESDARPGQALRVHIAGAVIGPGVYELEVGARVEDVVAAAGGPADGADLGGINLARRVRDGEQVFVPGSRAPMTAVLQPGELLDLNLATREQLIALPGIGEAYSRRIVDSRAVDGPFLSVDEVLERGLVPARTLEGIRAMVTVSLP